MRVASRCPHCGLIFSPDMIPPAEPSRLRQFFLVGAALALVVVIMLARMQNQPQAAPAATAPAESRPEPPATVSTPPSGVQPPAPAGEIAVDSPPPPTAAPPQAAPPRAAPPPAAPMGEQLQRYAGTWVNVRDRRSPSGASVRVLNPGEAILVDSLIGGWYRVVIGGQAIGYAYNSNLSEEAL